MSRVQAFCDRLRDRLFESIREASCLTEMEKHVLAALWSRCNVRTQTVEEYPGHSAFGRDIGVTDERLSRCLHKLERKGFVKSSGSTSRKRQLAYVLNALLLEASFDTTKDAEGHPLQ